MFRYCIGAVALVLCAISSSSAASETASHCTTLDQVQKNIENSGKIQFDSREVEASALNLTGVTTTNNFAICRVTGTISYGALKNNTLSFEVWLPETSNYNGRYISVGNGGFAGTIDYQAMMTNLNAGYAVGGGDSGHNSSQNGPNRPGGFVDFLNNKDETRAWIHDSIAMFTAPAKKLATAYYGKQPKKMYYAGCSTGGAQGFALAQYHPEIFDGIFAGSPGNWYSHLILSFMWNGLNSNSTEAFLSQSALNLTKAAVLKKCDEIDGVNDGIIEDPEKCDFDISTLQCARGQHPVVANTTVCLTSAQIENAKLFYSGPSNRRTAASVYPGFAFGSEAEWLPQETALWIAYGVPILQNLVFKNLSYDYTQFNWDSDVGLVDKNASPLIDETSPDLRTFKRRGGKLVVTQGWADPFNAPTWPIQQRDQMSKIFGDSLNSFFSLFMVPGGGHCGGAGSYPQMPGTWHGLDVLVPWVEEGTVPQEMLASDPADGTGSTRKLCPYPKKAVYIAGSTKDWESYICK